jgi:UDP-glucose 4-epimerase/UDP-glucuronate decarboxylase
MKRILVTGAAGFIGSRLALELAARGHDVVGVDSFMKYAGRPRPSPDGFELRELDLCESDLDVRLGGGYDEAYHMAAVVGVERVCAAPALTVRNNALSTLRFLDWARAGVRGRVLFGSTCEAYAALGGTPLVPVPTPEDVFLGVRDIAHPRWSYAASKILGEVAFAHRGGPFAIVRYHNVYGPAMHSRHVIPELFSRIWQGERPLRVASAAHTRTFCHVRDAVAGTIAAMEAPAAQDRVVNVGSDDAEIAMGELARRMVRVSGRDVQVLDAPAVDASVARRRGDIAFLKRLLGEHRFVPLEEGLRECWAWQERTGWVA